MDWGLTAILNTVVIEIILGIFVSVCSLWKLLPFEWAGNADTERWTSHFPHDTTTAPYVIINNEGYNDDDNNNNTINNWNEEQSRQKVLLLGKIIRNILCSFYLLIWADVCILWSVKWNVVLRILRECGCGLLQLSPGTESRFNWKVQAHIANCWSMAFLIKSQWASFFWVFLRLMLGSFILILSFSEINNWHAYNEYINLSKTRYWQSSTGRS